MNSTGGRCLSYSQKIKENQNSSSNGIENGIDFDTLNEESLTYFLDEYSKDENDLSQKLKKLRSQIKKVKNALSKFQKDRVPPKSSKGSHVNKILEESDLSSLNEKPTKILFKIQPKLANSDIIEEHPSKEQSYINTSRYENRKISQDHALNSSKGTCYFPGRKNSRNTSYSRRYSKEVLLNNNYASNDIGNILTDGINQCNCHAKSHNRSLKVEDIHIKNSVNEDSHNIRNIRQQKEQELIHIYEKDIKKVITNKILESLLLSVGKNSNFGAKRSISLNTKISNNNSQVLNSRVKPFRLKKKTQRRGVRKIRKLSRSSDIRSISYQGSSARTNKTHVSNSPYKIGIQKKRKKIGYRSNQNKKNGTYLYRNMKQRSKNISYAY